MLVSTFQQILVLGLFVLPGFVFQVARTQLMGTDSGAHDPSYRLLSALGYSVAFAICYFLAFSERVSFVVSDPQVVLRTPFYFGITGLLFVFVIPIALATVLLAKKLYSVFRSQNSRLQSFQKTLASYVNGRAFQFVNNAPSAWDYFALKPARFVRVQVAQGHWVGGALGADAFHNISPSPHEIYIEQPWSFGKEGNFVAPIPTSCGIWINCVDVVSVEKMQGHKRELEKEK